MDHGGCALLVGVKDLTDQSVDIVIMVSGDRPGYDEVLTEKMNSGNGVYGGKAGDRITMIDSSGHNRTLAISGVGKSILSLGETTEGVTVFYAGVDTVRDIGNISGYNSLRL